MAGPHTRNAADSASLPTTGQRVEARDRPAGRPAMLQVWRDLLFLHWEADPAELAARLPPGLHLDLFDGRAYLGVVPFFMHGVRPRHLPALPGLSAFRELNVRTYVHDDRGTPGVWFFSLDASNPIACAIARARFHLPYFHARIKARRAEWIDYDCRRNGTSASAAYRYRPDGSPSEAVPGTFEFFLVERYHLFATARRKLLLGTVHHAPYRLQSAQVERWSAQPIAWDGLPLPEASPCHICYAAEVEVEVFSLNPTFETSSVGPPY